MSKKRGLGRGLSALIPSDPDQVTSEAAGEEERGVRNLAISAISPNPHQPRAKIAAESLVELADSIREHGLIQPLIVTEAEGGYTLIAGERRWRAAQLADLAEVPIIIKEATPQEMLELALIENIQRADLNPLEEAFAYQQLIDEFHLTQDEVAKRIGKGRSTVANLLRLLSLPDNIKQAVIEERITGAHARALLPLPAAEMQTAAMNQIIKLSLSVRQTETLVKNLLLEKRVAGESKKKTLPAELISLQSEFEHKLGTRVAIEKGPKGGRVVIYYYSDDDLQAVYDAIIGSQ
jgi:ParB family chromosome partitioning protein